MGRLCSLCLICLIAWGCATTEKGDPLQVEQDEVLPGGDFSGSLPPALWSPGRRKVTASYYVLVAEYKALEGDREGAERLYSAAYDLEPGPYLGQKMVAAKASLGNYNQAILDAKKLSLMHPKDPDVRSLFGRLLLKSGDFSGAENEFKSALQLNKKHLSSFFGLISCHQLQRNWPKAIAAARQLTRIAPFLADGWVALAKIYLYSSNRRLALSPARKAYDLASRDPEKILVYALALEVRGQSDQAIKLYEELYNRDPENPDLIQKMVGIYRRIDELDLALEILNDSYRRKKTPGLLLQRGLIHWELGKFEEAAKLLAELAELGPKSDRNIYMAGLGQEKIGQFAKALLYYRRIESDSSYFLHAQSRLVHILRHQKQYEEAIVAIRSAVIDQTDSRFISLYIYGAHIYADMNRVPDALELLDKGQKSFPGHVSLMFVNAVYLERSGQVEACIEQIKEVLAKEPNHHASMNFLGYIYAELDRSLDEAERLLRRALELKPADGYYTDSLAWVYFKKGELEKAKEFLNLALRLIPNEGVVFEHLGEVYLAEGNKKEALQLFGKALQVRLDDRDRKRIKERMAELQDDA